MILLLESSLGILTMIHPEAPEGINEVIDFVEKQEVVDVWCKGCQMYRKMNGAYAVYVSELRECRFCRGNNE